MKNSQRVESPEGVDLIPSRDGRIRTGDFLLPIQDACLLTGHTRAVNWAHGP